MDVKKLMAEGSLDNLSEDLFKSVSSYSEEVKAFQRQKAAEYADQVVAALKKIEQDIKDRYDRVGLTLEKRVLNIKDGKDGINGRDGRDGKDGKPGAAGLPGRDGKDGKNGRDGVDGKDGVSVVNAFLDFDNSLVIELSNGKQVNAGAILGADFAEKVKIIANGGGTSQGVIDTLASLQAQISAISSLGAVSYQGTWNASTNTPTITASVGTKGYYYVVSVAGTTSIDGESKWGVGDWIVFNGSAWQKVDGGSTGNLTTLDVSSSATLSYGTANTVARLDGSKNLIGNSSLTYNGSTLGVTGLVSIQGSGTVPSSGAGLELSYLSASSTSSISSYDRTNSAWLDVNYRAALHRFSVSGTEQMRLDSTGLGIGTSSPGAKLHASLAGAGALILENTLNTGVYARWKRPNREYYLALDINNNGGNDFTLYDATAGASRWTVDASGNLGLGVTPSAWTGTALQVKAVGITESTLGGELSYNTYRSASTTWNGIATGGAARYGMAGDHRWYIGTAGGPGSAISFTQAMTLDASGNLAVGNTVSKGRAFINNNASSASVGANPVLWLGNGTAVSGQTTEIGFTYGTSSGVNPGTYAPATMGYVVTSGLGFTQGDLVFSTRNVTTDTQPTERMRLDSSGNLLVGCTTGYIAAMNSFGSSRDGIHVGVSAGAGTVYSFIAGWYSSTSTSRGTLSFNVTSNGNVTNTNNSYGAISDIKLKENITDATPKLAQLCQVRVVNYNFKEGQTQKQIGVIAQELEQVFPSMVDETADFEMVTTTDEDGNEITERRATGTTTKSVKYSVFVPMLIKAIQELKAEVDSLKAQLNK